MLTKRDGGGGGLTEVASWLVIGCCLKMETGTIAGNGRAGQASKF